MIGETCLGTVRWAALPSDTFGASVGGGGLGTWQDPDGGTAPVRSKRYEYRLNRKRQPALLPIYHDSTEPTEPTERREGARLCLTYEWRAGYL